MCREWNTATANNVKTNRHEARLRVCACERERERVCERGREREYVSVREKETVNIY